MIDDLASRLLAAIEETERIAQEEGDGSEVDRLSMPGHDRDVARAIHNQARIRSGAISEVQVRHLLLIGYTRGQRRSDAVYRRCLADRRVWRRHEPNVIDGRETPVRISCVYCSSGRVDAVPWPCPDALDLAEGYGITSEAVDRG